MSVTSADLEAVWKACLEIAEGQYASIKTTRDMLREELADTEEQLALTENRIAILRRNVSDLQDTLQAGGSGQADFGNSQPTSEGTSG